MHTIRSSSETRLFYGERWPYGPVDVLFKQSPSPLLSQPLVRKLHAMGVEASKPDLRVQTAMSSTSAALDSCRQLPDGFSSNGDPLPESSSVIYSTNNSFGADQFTDRCGTAAFILSLVTNLWATALISFKAWYVF